MGDQDLIPGPEQAPVSALLGAECVLYVVTGSTGEYSGRSEWLTRAFADEESAKNYVLYLTRERQKLPAWDWENEETIEGHMLALDPGFSEDYSGTRWFVQPVTLSAAPFVVPADGPKGQDGQLRADRA